jgi:hypothetical protein
VIFDDLGKERRGLDGHAYLRLGFRTRAIVTNL